MHAETPERYLGWVPGRYRIRHAGRAARLVKRSAPMKRTPMKRTGIRTANKGKDCTVGVCDRSAYCRGYCQFHYGRLRKYGDPLREPPSFAERFWERVDRSGGPDACWPWRGTKSQGYGNLGAEPGRKQERAHAVAWRLTNGPLPLGKQLDHTCHTNDPDCSGGKACLHRRCCNPAHLEPVTSGENNARSWQRRLNGKTCAKGHTCGRDSRGRCYDCRSGWEKSYRKQGKRVTRIPDSVKAIVLLRCGSRCEACGQPLAGGRVTHFHHRQTRRLNDNRPCNIVALHSTCHVLAPEAVHQRPAWARSRGLIVSREEDPADVPVVLASGRRVLLDDLGPWYLRPADGGDYCLSAP